jgi:hypothetical protein
MRSTFITAIPVAWTAALLLCAMLCATTVSCTKHKNGGEKVPYDTTGLRNGDLLFRNGCGYESKVVTNLSSGNYSHIGMAYRAPSGWCVIHAVPGEAAEGEPEYLKCESIDEFYRVDRAKAGARARVNCTDSVADAATRHAMQLVERRVVFDNDYDLDDSSQLYCTELIRLVYAGCGVDLCEERWHKAPIIAKGSVIYPEDIWQSPLLIHKKEF